MKKYIYSMAVVAALMAATSCNDDDVKTIVENKPDSEKEMISFTLSDAQGATTRAGFTGADTRIVARFQSDEKVSSGTGDVRYTKTFLSAKKDNSGKTDDFSTVEYSNEANNRYWDDAFGRKGQISVYAVAIPNSTSTEKLTDAKLSGSATAWQTETTPDNSIQWDVTYETTQNSTTLAAEDLVYSNNIQAGGKNGRYVWDYAIDSETNKEKGYPANNGKTDGHKDGQLVFTQKDGAQASDAGHFDRGHLMFKHALSRLTVVLTPGTGFTTDRSNATDFKFNKIAGTVTSGNIQLLNFPVGGTLNLKTGSWTTASTQNILQMIGAAATADVTVEGTTTPGTAAPAAKYDSDAAKYEANRTYSAQMLPGKVFHADGTDNVMQFVIDDNTYYITEKMVYDALAAVNNNKTAENGWADAVAASGTEGEEGYVPAKAAQFEMKQGKNYKLSITVNKTGIANVTATLEPWVNVAGDMTVNNAHITLSLKTTGSTCDKDIDLYRLDDDYAGYDANQFSFSYEGKNWFGNYTTDTNHKTTLEHSALANGKWTTPWYFESNKTYYHFRTVNKGTTIKGNTGTGADETKDYFEISAGPTTGTNAVDPHWGAPMKEVSGTTWLKYDTDKGYEAHLHHAIGATESQITIQEIHMMSNIEVVLETPNDGGKVQLYKPAVAAVLYADAAEYNAAKGTSLDDAAFAALTDEQKTKTPAEEAVGTVIKITRLATTGQVEMGRGVVTPTGAYTGESTMTSPSTATASDYYETSDTKSKTYTYAVVPQSLSRNFSSTSDDDFVGIFIQTPDNNQYYVVKKLSEIYATTVSDERDQTAYDNSEGADNEAAKIKRWYPGHKYTYTFTITKTGITNVTCTVADWVTVTGANTNIDLES